MGWRMGNNEISSYGDSQSAYFQTGAPLPEPQRPRRGPLSSRLEARARLTPLPDTAANPYSRSSSVSAPSNPGGDATSYQPGGASVSDAEHPAWSMISGILRTPGEAAEALRDGQDFGASWSSRADMLGACLDEYYQLTARLNDSRTLRTAIQSDIATLRQQRFSVFMKLREMEERLEMYGRVELRAAYLGAAEVEMRVFRAEQERDLLDSRIMMLEGFMQFLSQVIATVRAIPASAMDQGTPAASASSTPASATGISVEESVYEELEVDADEAEAMLASGEVEVIGLVEE